MGKRLVIEWQETASTLKELYREERHAERKIRLQALWQLRLGRSLKEVAEQVGMAYRTLQKWVAWYRCGGLDEVLRRIKGHGKQGRPAKLKLCQQKALVSKVALGCFRTIWDVRKWVHGRSKALQEAELTAMHRIYFSDEMRFGLWGQTRKR